MNTLTLDHPRTTAAFGTVKLLIGCYAVLSLLTLAAIVLMRHDAAAVTTAVWVRASIVIASSMLMAYFANRAAEGSARAFLRLRIVSAVMVLAIAAIIAVGSFPLWFTLEQGVCGVLLIGVVVMVNRRDLRSWFASR